MHLYYYRFGWNFWRFGLSVDKIRGPLDIALMLGPFTVGLMSGPPKLRYYDEA